MSGHDHDAVCNVSSNPHFQDVLAQSLADCGSMG
mgnify:CR=1 FL=1|jgi:hypothetical protein